MYDVIYDAMIESRVASRRPIPVYTDREGKEVGVGERFGLEQDIKIDHKHYLLFADKSGCGTNKKRWTSRWHNSHCPTRNSSPDCVLCE